MKRTMLLAAAALVAPAAAHAQTAFEGTVKAVMSGGGMEIEIEQHARGRMLRQDMTMQGGSVSVITDNESGKVLMLMHAQKMWMDMAAMSQMMGGMGRGAQPPAAAPPTELPEIRRTDRVETIAGHECRHYIMPNPNGEVDLCAMTGMGFFMPGGGPPGMGGMAGRGQSPSMPALPANAEIWQKEFKDGFFVLKVDASTAQGKVSWVVRSLEKKTIPEEMFKPPPGYNEMKMPGRGG